MYAGSALVCHATLSWTRLSFNAVRTLVKSSKIVTMIPVTVDQIILHHTT